MTKVITAAERAELEYETMKAFLVGILAFVGFSALIGGAAFALVGVL